MIVSTDQLKALSNILVIEDNPIDASALKRIIRKVDDTLKVDHSENGKDAMQWLFSEENVQPDLILLDLNMPVMNGFDFLDSFGKEAHNRSIPIIVYTTSQHAADIQLAYEKGACGYFVKSIDAQESQGVINSVINYWNHCEFRFMR